MSDQQTPQQFSRTSLAVAVSAACVAAPSAHAQKTAIEEIVVTATKREASIQDVPMSITAFGNDEIVREGFKQLDDYAGRIPALSFGTRHPGGSNVIMRGCAVSGIAFSDNPTTSVYLDEQPITVAGFNPDPRLIDIERLEALSGPQGSLFGDASQCGTLRIITNKPRTDEFDGWVDLGVSSVAHGDVGYDVSGMVNFPIADDKAALRLVGFFAEEAGYIDNVLGGSPTGPLFPAGGVSTFDNAEFVAKDVNGSTTIGGRASLRWLPTEDWTVDIGAIYQKLEEDGFGDTDIPENFLDGRSLGEWQQMRYEEEDFEDEWYQLALTLEGRLGGADVVLATSFLNREYLFRADATTYLSGWQERYPNKISAGGYYAIYDFLPDQDPRAQVFSTGESDRTSIELRVATPGDSDSRWSGIVGAFYNKSEEHAHFSSNVDNLIDSGTATVAYAYGAHFYLNYVAFYYNCGPGDDNINECIYPVAPSNNWWTGVYDNTLKQTALFGEIGFDITDNFSITAGGRWFSVDLDRRLQQSTLVGGLSDYRTMARESDCSGSTGDHCYQDTLSSSSESGFVPKVTLNYDLSDNVMVYGTYSEGFRRGGANAAKPRSIFGRAPYNQFSSDLVKNYEVGTKTTLADGRVQLNLTAYRMVWEDMQIEAEDPTPNLFTLGILNFPEAEITGVEAFLNWLPADGWNVTANIGFNDAELSKSGTLEVEGAPIDRSAEKGTRLPLTPDMKASLNIDRYLDNTIWGAAPSFGIGIQHTGDSVNSLSGIQSVEFDQPVRTQDAYTLVNLRFGLEAEGWSASLFVNNATDEYAEQFYNDRWAQTRLSVNRPRTIGVNYRRNFE
ncbi:MAG: TonB-dependent receptor [Gammaproteobacteria bacterium]|nr:TonB-dependent receptor [Gammaproteobacteria bacterium]MDH3578648.1 TonB-dependent receptor [Gammaproteobacteria bacterium]